VNEMTVEIGTKAPGFTLEAQTGETVTLSDLQGKNVVIYFYPKDMTPGCTTEACDFRDQYQEFADLNAVILGISPDPVERHQKFVEKYSLPFLLLADTDHQVAEAYGVWKLKKNFGKEYMGIERSTFVVDKEGKIAKEWRKVTVKGHVEEALAFIRENL
jgi:thioredoxin-dependent peroxiredoxin